MLRLKIISLLAAIGVAFTGVVSMAIPQSVDASNLGQACSKVNDIVPSGVNSVEALKKQYHDNKNNQCDLQNIFAKFGIHSKADFSGVTNGTVYRDGRVVVNGKTVATGARSVGRHNLAGSTRLGGTKVYIRPVSVSFNSSSLTAFVKMQNGKFQWAVLKDCGNPVTATPVKPEKPQPEKPNFACVDLNARFMGKAKNWKVEFTAHGRAKNAKIQGYIFYFGDGSGKGRVNTSANVAKTTHQYKKAGKHVAYVIVDTNKGQTKRVNACEVTVVLSQKPAPEVPTPTTPDIDIDIDNDNTNVNNNTVNVKNVVKAGRGGSIVERATAEGKGELPNTGPEALLGITGSGGLGIGIRKYLQSRKNLLNALLK